MDAEKKSGDGQSGPHRADGEHDAQGILHGEDKNLVGGLGSGRGEGE